MKIILSKNTFTKIFTFTAISAIFFVTVPLSYAETEGKKGCGYHKGKKFEKTDTNADGVISHEEFLAKAENRFKKMDADGDGKITKEEAKNHHASMREKYKKHHEGMKSAY